jgi:hypothetical protein
MSSTVPHACPWIQGTTCSWHHQLASAAQQWGDFQQLQESTWIPVEIAHTSILDLLGQAPGLLQVKLPPPPPPHGTALLR